MPCHRLSLIGLRHSFLVHITVGPGGLHTRVCPPGKAPDLGALEYSRRAGWHGPAVNSTREKAINSTACSTARRRGNAKNMITQKCGTKSPQERRAEQRGRGWRGWRTGPGRALLEDGQGLLL